MDFNSLSIAPVVPAEPLKEQAGQDMLPPAVVPQGEGEGEQLVFVAQAVLAKVSAGMMGGGEFVTRHRIHKSMGGGKNSQHTATPLKGGDTTARVETQQTLQSLSHKAEVGQVFKAGREPVIAKAERGEAFKGGDESKYTAIAHRLGTKEIGARMGEVFDRRSPGQTEKLDKGFEGVKERRPFESETSKMIRPTEKEKESEKPEEKERLSRRSSDKLEDRENGKGQGHQIAPKIHSVPIQLPDRIPPELLAAMGLLTASVQQMVNSAEFRSAQAVIIVEGLVEKAFISHVLRLLGRNPRQVYIWVIGQEESCSSAWSLLHHLGMPCVTLLNLELGRRNGGWDKVKLCLRRLLSLHGGQLGELTDEDIAMLPYWDSAVDGMDPWLDLLEAYGVFFALPLDLDFMLLRAFPRPYSSFPIQQGNSAVSWKQILEVAPQTLRGYSASEIDSMGLYHALFCKEQRLLVHQHAWRLLGPMEMVTDLPPVFHRMLNRCHFSK